MSYSINDSCYDCEYSNKCTDKNFIQGAISGIHYTTYEQGHKGAGSISIECINFKSKNIQNNE